MDSVKPEEVKRKVKPVTGVVTSDRMHKSRVATITRKVKHPLVGKYITRSTKIMFHDENNTSRLGDTVLISPAKPRSCRKSFDLVSVVEKAKSYIHVAEG